MENRPIPDLYGFTNHMSHGEIIAAAIYLPIHVVGLPFGLAWLVGLIPALAQLSDTELNMLYYGLGLVYVLIALRGFLRRSFDVALDHKGRLLLGALGGYAVNIGASFVISALLLIFGLELGMSPNNQAIMTEAAVDYRRMAVMVIVMAPVVEEPLFRGLLFSKYDTVHLILATDFPIIPENQRQEIALRLVRICAPIFRTYDLKDDFSERPEFRRLKEELRTGIRNWIDENGVPGYNSPIRKNR